MKWIVKIINEFKKYRKVYFICLNDKIISSDLVDKIYEYQKSISMRKIKDINEKFYEGFGEKI